MITSTHLPKGPACRCQCDLVTGATQYGPTTKRYDAAVVNSHKCARVSVSG